MNNKTKKSSILTTTQLAKALGVGRTTVQRMETAGIIKPCLIAHGNHYYDVQALRTALRAMTYRDFGLSRNRIVQLLNSEDDNSDFAEIKERIFALERVIYEMKCLVDDSLKMEISDYVMPECRCFVVSEKLPLTKELVHSFFTSAYRKAAMERGYTIRADRTLYMVTDIKNVLDGNMGVDVCGCRALVPIMESRNQEEECVVKESRCFMTHFYADEFRVREILETILEKIKAEGLKDAGEIAIANISMPPKTGDRNFQKMILRMAVKVKE